MERRKRQRKWNGHGLLFLKYFYFIFHFPHYLALFVLHFIVLMKIIKKLVAARGPDGGKKEIKEIERTYM